jgi:hypothetical protein
MLSIGWREHCQNAGSRNFDGCTSYLMLWVVFAVAVPVKTLRQVDCGNPQNWR